MLIPSTSPLYQAESASATAAGATNMGLPLAAFVVPAVAQAIASIWGANKASSSANKAAQMQVDAANKAALLQQQTAEQQLAFLREQDALDRKQAELDRKMGYDQWAYKQGNLSPYRGIGNAAVGNLGHLMGFQPSWMEVPDARSEVPYTPYDTDSPIPPSLYGNAAAAPVPQWNAPAPVMETDREWDLEEDEQYSW